MPYQATRIGTLIRADAWEDAKAEMNRILVAAGGNATHAALAAGCHHTTFMRWVSILGMTDRLKEIRVEEVAPPSMPTSVKRQRAEALDETRRAAALRRTYDQLTVPERIALAARARVNTGTLAVWREGPGGVNPRATGAIEAEVVAERARIKAARQRPLV